MSRRLAARPFAGPWVVGLALTACVLTACHGSTDVTADAGSNDTDAGAHDGGLTDGGSVDGGTSDGGTSDGGVEVKITALYPAQGPIAGGTQSLLSGAGFVEGIASRGGGAVSKVTELRIGGVLAKDVDVIDDNRISLTTPPGVAGAADVTVTNPNGTGTCTGCFRYLAHVEIDSITPARGPVQGGTAVTVKGLGFDSTLSLTLDGAPLVDLVVVDGTTATGKTPPGVAGAADLLAITKDGNALGHSAFVYADALTLTSVTPSVVPIAGGGALTAHGTGFTAQAALSIEGVSIDTRWIDEETLGFTAPAHAEGAATLTVIDPGALEPQLATLPRALVYVDDSTGTPRPLALAQIAPRTGPVAGGTCPTACVRLLGAGFSVDDLVVTIAGNAVPAASLHLVDDRTLDLDLPAAASAGPVAIEVSSASRSESAQLAASDPGAFRYLPLLSVTRVSPDRAPANGAPATQLSIEGAGFADSAGAPLQVLVGALPLTNVTIAPSGSSLIGNAPHGASGLAAITVIATDTDGYVRTATLADALRFTAPLKLLQLNPSRGSQAGGTGVDLLGDGFEPGMTATLAGTIMSDLTVVSATRATAHTPPGNPGEVAAAVQLATQAATLPAAFNYFDPSANAGGTGGGPLLGDLNVSVLENSLYKDGGVAQATVTVHLHDGSVLTGLTDFRGQITFDDPRLVLPCDVTVAKAQYEGITIVGVAVENVSVYLSGPAGTPPPPPDPPPPPPPPPQSAVLGGHVYGFKAPPGLTLQANQQLVAWVLTTGGSIYSVPPFSPVGKPQRILADGGTWSFTTTRLSPTTVYALFGVETTTGTNLYSMSPLLLGVHRNLQPDPARPMTDGDIILDTHLDQSVTAAFTGLPGDPATLTHTAAVSLDLGSSGLLPLSSATTSDQTIVFKNLPAAQGQGFVFIDLVQGGSSESVYLRRIFGDVSGGLTLGPYMPFPHITAPTTPQGPFGSQFSWTFQDGALTPNLVQLNVFFPHLQDATNDGLSWGAVLPPGTTSVAFPPELLPRLHNGIGSWSVTASLAPGFDYGYWSYYDLGGTGWNTWAYDTGTFKVGP